MGRTTATFVTLLAGGLAMACATPAHADRALTPQRPILMPSKSAPSPYRIELVDGVGRQLPTYASRGRFYVLGHNSSRYSLRVHNPTSRRIEAVVSVDGLDVIDGQTANFKSKRGYVVPPHDSVTIEGFRTSTSNVATFRFSSVGNSYAGRKGKARNVGVIGVAIFEERATAAIVHPRPYYKRGKKRYRYEDYLDEDDGYAPSARNRSGRGSADRAPAPRKRRVSKAKRPAPPRDMPAGEAEAPVAGGRYGGARGGSAGAPATSRPYRPAPRRRPTPPCYTCNDNSRPGLGTKYGEQRYSAVSWTRFQRKSNRPDAIATLRYNNATGLAALGIYAPHGWDTEVATRETADPFPGSFAPPPR